MDQQIRFCVSPDGVNIAYACSGRGPAFVKAANWMSHLEYDWHSSVWQPIIEEFSKDQTVVRYDQRGTGLSDRNVKDLTLDAFVEDLETVVDALGLERFPVFGVSQGVPVAIAYAAKNPERVSHLILLGGFAAGWKAAPLDEKALEKRKAQLVLIRQGWSSTNPAIRQLWSSLCIPESSADDARSFNEMQRASASPENAARIFEAIGEFDVIDRLGSLHLPVLVAHAVGDAVVPFDEGRRLAAGIPEAKFMVLESQNHLLMKNEPAWAKFVDEVRGFIGRQSGGSDEFHMKICSSCQRKYDDPQMMYCLDDGNELTPLLMDETTRRFDLMEGR